MRAAASWRFGWLGIALALAAGCQAAVPEGVRLAAAIEAERTGRFSGLPEQTARDVAVHSEYPGALPPGVALAAAADRTRFRELLGRTDDAPPLTVLVFDSPSRLQAALGVSPGVHGLALASRTAPVIVLAAGEGDTALLRHLRHEITHIVSDLSSDPTLAPDRAAWVEEGLAYLLEWSDDDGVPRPSLGLLEILHASAPDAGAVPELVSAHYRPRGDAPTMRRLAAAAATLIHFYWDRAARQGTVDVRPMLTECARRSRAELQADTEAWQAHWGRLLQLARARSFAAQAARYCEEGAARLRTTDDRTGAAWLTGVADAAQRLHDAAREAAGPGGDLEPARVQEAGTTAAGLARWVAAIARRRPGDRAVDRARIGLDRLVLAVQAAEAVPAAAR